MKKIVKVGTRKSPLAVIQTEIAVSLMEAARQDVGFELVYKLTKGDRILDRPLLSFGGKGVFVSEFEEGLQCGEIDFAVHSAKDLPMELGEGLAIVGVPKREDPRDVLICPKGRYSGFGEKGRVVVGTSSLRRKVQIEEIGKKRWPEVTIVCENLRGNVQTRLSKLDAGEFDAIILAAAGLKRLGLDQGDDYDLTYFDWEELIPAGGQGILVIEGRAGDPVCQLAEGVNDRDALLCLNLERKVLRLLNAGCHEPVGVFARVEGEDVILNVLYPVEGRIKKVKKQAPGSQWEWLAEAAVKELLG